MKKSKKANKRKKYQRAKQKYEQKISRLQEIPLAEHDRITYLYKRDRDNTIYEVTNVSYEIRIENVWVTIIRYDSFHGFLHKHILVSLENPTDTPTDVDIDKQGDHAEWLTWAINDIKKNFSNYKLEFLKRSGIL